MSATEDWQAALAASIAAARAAADAARRAAHGEEAAENDRLANAPLAPRAGRQARAKGGGMAETLSGGGAAPAAPAGPPFPAFCRGGARVDASAGGGVWREGRVRAVDRPARQALVAFEEPGAGSRWLSVDREVAPLGSRSYVAGSPVAAAAAPLGSPSGSPATPPRASGHAAGQAAGRGATPPRPPQAARRPAAAVIAEHKWDADGRYVFDPLAGRARAVRRPPPAADSPGRHPRRQFGAPRRSPAASPGGGLDATPYAWATAAGSDAEALAAVAAMEASAAAAAAGQVDAAGDWQMDAADYEAMAALEDVRVGLDAGQVARLPEVVLDASQAASLERRGASCCVCMCPYQAGDRVRSLPCFHQFHSACIATWLRDSKRCPVDHEEVRV